MMQEPPIFDKHVWIHKQYENQGTKIANIFENIIKWSLCNKTKFYREAWKPIFLTNASAAKRELKQLLTFAHDNGWAFVDEKKNTTRPYIMKDVQHRFIRVFLHLHANSKANILDQVRQNENLAKQQKINIVQAQYANEIQLSKQHKFAADFDIPWMHEIMKCHTLLTNLYDTIHTLHQNYKSHLMFWSCEWQAEQNFWTQINDYVCGPAWILTQFEKIDDHHVKALKFTSFGTQLCMSQDDLLFDKLHKLTSNDYDLLVATVCQNGFEACRKQKSTPIKMSADVHTCFEIMMHDMLMKAQKPSERFLSTHPDDTYESDVEYLQYQNSHHSTFNQFFTPAVFETGARALTKYEQAIKAQRIEHANKTREERAHEREEAIQEQVRRGGEQHAHLSEKGGPRKAHGKKSSGPDSYEPVQYAENPSSLQEEPETAVDEAQYDYNLQQQIFLLQQKCKKIQDEQDSVILEKTFYTSVFKSDATEMIQKFHWNRWIDGENFQKTGFYRDIVNLELNELGRRALMFRALEYYADKIKRLSKQEFKLEKLKKEHEQYIVAYNNLMMKRAAEPSPQKLKNLRFKAPDVTKIYEDIDKQQEENTKHFRSLNTRLFYQIGIKCIEKAKQKQITHKARLRFTEFEVGFTENKDKLLQDKIENRNTFLTNKTTCEKQIDEFRLNLKSKKMDIKEKTIQLQNTYPQLYSDCFALIVDIESMMQSIDTFVKNNQYMINKNNMKQWQDLKNSLEKISDECDDLLSKLVESSENQIKKIAKLEEKMKQQEENDRQFQDSNLQSIPEEDGVVEESLMMSNPFLLFL